MSSHCLFYVSFGYVIEVTRRQYAIVGVSLSNIKKWCVTPKLIVSGCKSKTSYGHDEISMKTVKHVIKQIVRPLTYIFNRSLITGIFPNDMKTAKVIPVFKSGDRLQLLTIDLYHCYPNSPKY